MLVEIQQPAAIPRKAPSGSTFSRAALAAAIAIIAVGGALRVAQYLANRSLWLDEAYLAHNLLSRDLLGLSQPLEYNQAAPFGFLALVRAAVVTFGTSEFALRLVSLVAGLLAIPAFFLCARRLLTGSAVLVATALFAFSEPLIYYASELKQYSTDVAVATVLLLLSLRLSRKPGLRAADILTAIAVGALSVWFSHPAVFILAGCGLALTWGAMEQRNRQRLGHLAIIGVSWIASFAVAYHLTMASADQNAVLHGYWESDFMPILPTSLRDLQWYPQHFFGFFGSSLGLFSAGLAALAAVIGTVVLFQERRVETFLLLGPVLMVLLASAFEFYPFSGRLVLFLSPVAMLLMAKGLQIIGSSSSHFRIVGWAAVSVLLFHPVANATEGLLRPRMVEEIRPVLAYLKNHLEPGDRVFMNSHAHPAFLYYTREDELDASIIVGDPPWKDSDRYVVPMERFKGQSRVWVLISHVPDRPQGNEGALLLYALDSVGTRRDSFVMPGSAVHLYDFSIPPGTH